LPAAKGESPSVEVDFVLKGLQGGGTGTVRVKVVPDWAPFGAKRFLDLVDAEYYDMNYFFRVVPGFVIQWGIPDDHGSMLPWMQEAITDDPVIHPNKAGTLAFGAAGPHSRTTQIFINLNNNNHLDGLGFATFAYVTEGFEHIEHVYAEYREKADQGMIHREGGKYIRENFPLMTYIETARRVVSSDAGLMEEDATQASLDEPAAGMSFLPVLGIVALASTLCGICATSGRRMLRVRDDPKDV
jgi:cyclophilin family peptidyl-prolyl cis-trans isomerase